MKVSNKTMEIKDQLKNNFLSLFNVSKEDLSGKEPVAKARQEARDDSGNFKPSKGLFGIFAPKNKKVNALASRRSRVVMRAANGQIPEAELPKKRPVKQPVPDVPDFNVETVAETESTGELDESYLETVFSSMKDNKPLNILTVALFKEIALTSQSIIEQ